MEQAEYPRFSKLVAELFARYPNTAMGELTISSWWKDLRKYETAAVEWAFANCSKGKPEFIPSAEAVRECAELEQKRLETTRRLAARGKLPAPKQAERPGLKPDSPFAMLASIWEQADKHYSQHPEARPVDLDDMRRAQFHETWEQVFGEKWGAA